MDERAPFTDAELDELPDYLGESVEGARATEQDRLEWEEEKVGHYDWSRNSLGRIIRLHRTASECGSTERGGFNEC